ncbi:MAG: succinylglutamate desuccinylase/aspartoacylase family protein [Chloroflexi bacterium]|nr:succinylglutamate desuccinylase/aspartoacylase family protein [Chloroflexota bacterium]
MNAQFGPIPLPKPGDASSGHFTFDDPLLGKYQWPFFAVLGRQPGLKFLLTAGIHAAEYTGTLAALRLGRLLASKAAQVTGTIVIIPLLNRPGFFERSVYVNPEDGQNLNRAFPGRADGTWSERFAHHLLNDVVVHFDRAMDMHAGDMVEALEPFLGFRLTRNHDVDQKSREMIDAHGGARWVARVEPGGDRAGMLYGAAAERGVPAILAESGGRGLVEEEAVARHVNGALNIWRTLGILSDEPPAPTTPPRLLVRNEWLRSADEGIFLCRVQPGERVAQGQVLGEMVDLLGEHLADITSPADGIILFTLTSPAIKRDGLLLAVGVSED